MKKTLTIISLLATLASNGQQPKVTLENDFWLPSVPPSQDYGFHYYPYHSPKPPITTTWETNMTFGGREIGFRSDGVVVWRLITDVSTTATNGYSYYITNAEVESLTYTNILLTNPVPMKIYDEPPNLDLRGVTNLVQLCTKIGHVWNYTNPKCRRCILCAKRETMWEEWK